MSKKTQLNTTIPEELLERARREVYFTPGLTLSSLMEEALTAKLRDLERKRGGELPTKKVKLSAGRPVKL